MSMHPSNSSRARPSPLSFFAFSKAITGQRHITALGLGGEVVDLKIPADHKGSPRRLDSDDESTLWPFYSRTIRVTVQAVDDYGEGLVDPAHVDPLHERTRAAIERLGLDGSRLELAVAVFGWGSDEVNGSLLGLVRAAWDDMMISPVYDHESGMGWTFACGFDPWKVDDSEHWPIEDVAVLHITALEEKP